MVENIHPLLRDVSLRILCPIHEYTLTHLLIQVAILYTLSLYVSLMPDLLLGDAQFAQAKPVKLFVVERVIGLGPHHKRGCEL